jgi:hypothetical protein
MRRSLVSAHEEGIAALMYAIIALHNMGLELLACGGITQGSCDVLSFDGRSVRGSLTPSFSTVVLILRAESGVSHDLFTPTRNSSIKV